MPQVVAFEDAKAHQFRGNPDAHGKTRLKTPFLPASSGDPDQPIAFLVQGEPGRVIDPHFHYFDQWQIVLEGRGKLGRHDVTPFCVQFTRAYTPYGPIVGDDKTGISFIALLAHGDSNAQYLPQARTALMQVPDRRPLHMARQVGFSSPIGGKGAGAVTLALVPDIRDEQGLFACSLTMGANAETLAPDPALGDGQYVIVISGSLWHADKEHHALTVVFVYPEDGPFPIRSGQMGLQAIIVNFPQTQYRVPAKTRSDGPSVKKKWQCELCAFVYDESMGLPDDGIAAGTRWQDIPESWTCPDCSAAKNDFRSAEIN